MHFKARPAKGRRGRDLGMRLQPTYVNVDERGRPLQPWLERVEAVLIEESRASLTRRMASIDGKSIRFIASARHSADRRGGLCSSAKAKLPLARTTDS